MISRILHLGVFLFFGIGTAAHAHSKVQKVENANYDWVESEYFSDDLENLISMVRIEVRAGSAHQNQANLLSFLDGINDPANQTQLKRTYRLSNKTYLILMRLAVGNMFAESQLEELPIYTHPVYLIKERLPWAVSAKKKFDENSKLDYRTYGQALWEGYEGLRLETTAFKDPTVDPPTLAATRFDLSENSRGPTQIKYLPPGFEKAFPHINKSNLRVPQYSSVATVAYLADAITTLARLAKKSNCAIPRKTFLYHLIYIYTGRSSEITKCEATLDENKYWRRSLAIQKELEAFLLTPKKKALNQEQIVRVQNIRSEISGREQMILIIRDLINQLESKRDRELILKPEHANSLIEYSIAAGLVTGTHVALKKFQSPKSDWAKKNICKRILLGRKRYFPILHSINGALIYALRNNESYDLISLDSDKLKLNELYLALRTEEQIIKRLNLDIKIIETGL